MVLRILPWALWAALLLFSVATYADLPAEIPQHFNAAGQVTRSAPRTLFSWFLLPGIAGLTAAFIAGLAAMLPKQPELFSFSEKERFLKLPEAFRAPVILRMRETLDACSALTMVIFALVQVMIWKAAQGVKPTGLHAVLLLGGTIVMVPVAFLLTARVNTAVDEAERRWTSSGASGL